MALRQFISHFTDRLKPFFTTRKGAKHTGWNIECDQAFTAIKQYLTESLILANPETSEKLYLYIDVSDVSVCTSLFKEDKYLKQRPIFFVRKSLSEAET